MDRLRAVERHTILYDAGCGFCRWSLHKLLAWDRRRLLRPLPLQDPEADRLLSGMAPARRMASWHLVSPDGAVRSAGDAVPTLLRLLPGGALPAAVAGALPGPTHRLYGWIARRRGVLGRVLGARACGADPAARPVAPHH